MKAVLKKIESVAKEIRREEYLPQYEKFLQAVKNFSDAGVSYGMMQTIIEYEWIDFQDRTPSCASNWAYGPERWEKAITELQYQLHLAKLAANGRLT